MMKITTDKASSDRCILRLEGQIAGAWITELQHLCEQAMQDDRALTLDLSGVTFVERRAASLLRSLVQTGRVALVGSTPFVVEQLNSERGPS